MQAEGDDHLPIKGISFHKFTNHESINTPKIITQRATKALNYLQKCINWITNIKPWGNLSLNVNNILGILLLWMKLLVDPLSGLYFYG